MASYLLGFVKFSLSMTETARWYIHSLNRQSKFFENSHKENFSKKARKICKSKIIYVYLRQGVLNLQTTDDRY